MIKLYLWKIAVALDQLVNAIFGGSPDETLSSRWAKGQEKGCKFCSFLCRILDMFEENHCGKSIERDETKDSWGGK